MTIQLPINVKFILSKLHSKGYDAYVVGGCIRDSLLNKPIKDWDITTSATPEQTMKLFEGYNIIETGLHHGTVTVVLNGEPFEITTFRTDGNYSDGRHPDSVKFTNNLLEDLQRRDFTINAMAYNRMASLETITNKGLKSITLGLIDPFGGQLDLKAGVIRCVGSPIERFTEDALRILRALRFAGRYDFVIHPETASAIHQLADTITKVSSERITSELFSIMSNNNCVGIFRDYSDVLTAVVPELKPMIGFDQNNPWHLYDVWEHTLTALKFSPTDDLIVNFAILFHDMGKPHCCTLGDDGFNHFKGHGEISADMTNTILRRLKFTNEHREKIIELIKYHDVTFEESPKSIKRWLNKIGEEQLRRLLVLRRCDILAQSNKERDSRLRKLSNIDNMLDDVLTNEECFSLSDLAVNGKDLILLGMKPGKELGAMLNEILELVMDSKLTNNKDEILDFVKKRLA